MMLPRVNRKKEKTVRPLKPHELEAVRKGRWGSAQTMIDRLLATIEVGRTVERVVEIEAKPLPAGNPEGAFEGREKVLVIVNADGWIEVYAERWIDVKTLELWPEQNADDAVPKLANCYKELHWPYKLRATGYPKFSVRPGEVLPTREELIDALTELLDTKTT